MYRKSSSGEFMPSLTRRRFLYTTGIGLGSALLAGCGLDTSVTTSASPLPAYPRAQSTGRTRSYTFETAPFEATIGGNAVSTWGYNGKLPGPELRLTEGDTLQVTVKNRLPDATTIHWHGVPLINSMDGVPDVTQKAIAPGSDFTYRFIVPVAGTYLFHSHVGLQLDRGLYGPLIVEAKNEPGNYDQDIALVLDDWLDGVSGTPESAMRQLIVGGDRMNMGNMGNMGSMDGMQIPPDLMYPFYLINGRSSDDPFEIQVRKGEQVRLRLINASASSIYHVALQGHRMKVTHTDGQPVEPVEVETLRIGMGERYDVLVTATSPGTWQLAALVEGTKKMARAVVRYKGNSAPTPAMDFLPPEFKGQMLTYKMLKAAPTLVVPPQDRQPDQIAAIQLSGGMGQYVWKMNDQVFSKSKPLVVTKNHLIRFQFENKSMMPHPMHLHGHFFQVDNGTGRGPMKDTVLVDAMQSLAINWISDNPGSWAFHCHNAYHQEGGMMRIVSVR